MNVLRARAVWGFLAGVALTSCLWYWISHRHAAVPSPVVTVVAAPLPVRDTPTIPVVEAMNLLVEASPAPISRTRSVFQPAMWTPPANSMEVPEPGVLEEPPVTESSLPDLPPGSPRVDFPPSGIPRQPHTVTIAADTLLTIRTSEPLSSKHNQEGDVFFAVLDQPLVIDGFIIADRGARVEGRVAETQAGVRAKGVSRIVLELTKLDTADGQKIDIHTAKFTKQGETSVGNDLGKVAFGTALGAAVGAAAGHGKGAAIGAAAGTAAGVAGVLLTRSEPAAMKPETKISFKIDQAVTITERLTN